MSGSKKIVKTVITGLEGEVIEEIARNAYQVTIRGVITNEEDDNYPTDPVSELRRLCELEGPRRIVNKLTTIYNITQIQIESWDKYGIAGEQSEQAYQINAWSYRPVKLVLRKGI